VRTALAVLLAAGAIGCGSISPAVRSSGDVQGEIRALPSYVRLTFTGLAFWRNKLYAGTNIGLLEIEGHRSTALYQWNSTDNVLEGPWVDQAGDALWVWDCHTLDFRRWDGREWTSTGLPPKKGYYSRGNILSSFRGFSDPARFWLEGAGGAWVWDRQDRRWVGEELPRGGLLGIAPTPDGLYAVVQGPRKPEIGKPWELELHVRTQGPWQRVTTMESRDLVEKVVGTSNGGFFLNGEGQVVGFDRKGFDRIEQPGRCEAIAATSEGHLLGSFPGKGLFERRGQEWTLRFPYPYDSREGKHWVQLAEFKGVVALATSEYSHLIDSDKGTLSWTGTSAVWVSKGDVLERVRLE
jgi:hypothetical protein